MSQVHDLLIISAGKYGRVALRLAKDAIAAGAALRIKGFIDDRPDILKPFGYTEPVIASAETYQPEPNDRFICAVGDNDVRRRYTEMIESRGGVFTTLVHPTTTVAERATLGPGTIVEPYVYIGCDVQIGSHNVIGSHTCISHDNRMGNYNQVCGHSNFGGNVVVEDHVFFGLGAIVVPQIVVGRYSFIAAGSVVISNVPAGTKMFGNPAEAYGMVRGQYQDR